MRHSSKLQERSSSDHSLVHLHPHPLTHPLDAFDPSTSNLKSSPARSINKIGHSLHTLSPLFRQISLSPENASIARSLKYSDPRILQSMVICKQPEIGGAVPSHQDSTFLYTDPPSAIGFWYALEDATVTNGCLSMLPGSHKNAEIKKRFVRREEGEGTTFIENEGDKFPAGMPGDGYAGMDGDTAEDNKKDFKVAPVKAGSLILIHGNLLHKSEANRSEKSRFIYTFHMIEGGGNGTRHVYDERNWLQPTKEGFSRLYGEGVEV
jgi:phytanoyl-CoA hydroxylase